MKVECNLHPNGRISQPVATAVMQMMDAGDLIVGVRPYGAHPDSEYAIVGIDVEADGMLVVRVMDGNGSYLAEPVKVKP